MRTMMRTTNPDSKPNPQPRFWLCLFGCLGRVHIGSDNRFQRLLPSLMGRGSKQPLGNQESWWQLVHSSLVSSYRVRGALSCSTWRNPHNCYGRDDTLQTHSQADRMLCEWPCLSDPTLQVYKSHLSLWRGKLQCLPRIRTCTAGLPLESNWCRKPRRRCCSICDCCIHHRGGLIEVQPNFRGNRLRKFQSLPLLLFLVWNELPSHLRCKFLNINHKINAKEKQGVTFRIKG